MKKQLPAFFSGFCAAALTLSLGATALAAGGQVTFNFANVALDGQRQIAAGADLTAANGQQVPASILYTDAAGGKTNYLPIRTICELLDQDIGYDAASQTILLGDQTVTAVTPAGRVWTRVLSKDSITYEYRETAENPHDAPPSYGPSHLPAGWLVEDVSSVGASTHWFFRGETGSLSLWCSYPGSGDSLSSTVKADPRTCLTSVAVGGTQGDLYQGKSVNLLAWEGADGVLFRLSGIQTEASVLLAVAESIQMAEGGTICQPDWLPDGYRDHERCDVAGSGSASWVNSQGNLMTWLYTTNAALGLQTPEGTSTAVAVNGVKGQYWATRETGEEESDTTVTVGGETVSGGGQVEVGGVTVQSASFSASRSGTLLWTTADGVTCRIQGQVSKADLLRMAESAAEEK